MKLKDRKINLLFAAAVFISMLVFFEFAHKLVVLDADDWTYIAQSRTALPGLRFWNPARILPEILMPWCSGLAVLIIMPLCGDYISALSIMHGIVLSLFVTLYVCSACLLLEKRFKLSPVWSALMSVVFLLLHFWAMRTGNYENMYLFLAHDVTCIFYYIIPTLLNASLVMLAAALGMPKAGDGVLKNGCLLLVVYLAVFSNLFSSCVLAIYLGVEILFEIIGAIKNKTAFMMILKQNVLKIAVILLWLVSAALEASGERGAERAAVGFAEGIKLSASYLLSSVCRLNRLFMLFSAALIGAALVLLAVRRGYKTFFASILAKLALSGIIMAFFLILLCAKVTPEYACRSDVLLALMFFVFAMVTVSGAYILSELPAAGTALPFVILIILSNTICPMKTFAESNDVGVKPEILMDVNRAIIAQAVEADKAGADAAVIEVLWFGTDECQWPHTSYMADRMSAALYKHGIISKNIKLEFKASEEFTRSFGLDFTK